MKKSRLKYKAIKISGKKYILVKDRIIYFNKHYKNGKIVTKIVGHEKYIRCKAVVYPDVENQDRYFTGHAENIRGEGQNASRTSPIEDVETSAVGRALAMMGIGVIDSIASADEMHIVKNKKQWKNNKPFKKSNKTVKPKLASDKQINFMNNLIVSNGKLPDVYYKENNIDIHKLTSYEASKQIEKLQRSKKS